MCLILKMVGVSILGLEVGSWANGAKRVPIEAGHPSPDVPLLLQKLLLGSQGVPPDLKSGGSPWDPTKNPSWRHLFKNRPNKIISDNVYL
jgi:hypothetical protein